MFLIKAGTCGKNTVFAEDGKHFVFNIATFLS